MTTTSMTVSDLLAYAADCTKSGAIDDLALTLQSAFEEMSPTNSLTYQNRQSDLENEGAFARVEGVRYLSSRFALEGVFEIRSGYLSIYVSVIEFQDNRGAQSQSTRTYQDLDVSVDISESDTLQEVANRAIAKFIKLHTELLELVGVVGDAAEAAARSCY